MFGEPRSDLERVARDCIRDRIGREPPPVWSLEVEHVGIHPGDPEWAYFIVRVPVTLTEVVERLRTGHTTVSILYERNVPDPLLAPPVIQGSVPITGQATPHPPRPEIETAEDGAPTPFPAAIPDQSPCGVISCTTPRWRHSPAFGLLHAWQPRG